MASGSRSTVPIDVQPLDRNMAGLEFPEHNFVFSNNFRAILADAGLTHLIDTSREPVVNRAGIRQAFRR